MILSNLEKESKVIEDKNISVVSRIGTFTCFLCTMKESKKEILEDIFYQIVHTIEDLRYVKLYRKQYPAPQGMGEDYWRGVVRRYGNFQKQLGKGCGDWYVIEFKDGRKELAYLRVLQNGIFSGMRPALYRGLLFPHIVTHVQFDAMKSISLAF